MKTITVTFVTALACVVALPGYTQGVVVRPVHEARPQASGIPGSGATANQQDLSAIARKLATPEGLTSTTDPQVCTQHGGFGAGLACKAQLPRGLLALVWNWKAGQSAASGFHVYRWDSGQRISVGDQANGGSVTVFIVDPLPTGSYNNVCFTVSAFSADQESQMSEAYCVGGGSTVQTLVLPLSVIRSSHRARAVYVTGPSSIDDSNPGNMTVGYNYNTWKNTVTGDKWDNEIWRTGLFFDVSQIMNRKIISARLKMTVYKDWTWSGGETQIQIQSSPPTDHSDSCTTKIDVGVDRWWNNLDWIDGTTSLEPGAHKGPDFSMDVTSIVRGWAQGNTNYGLVLEGSEENLSAFTEEGCVTQYLASATELDVQFQ